MLITDYAEWLIYREKEDLERELEVTKKLLEECKREKDAIIKRLEDRKILQGEAIARQRELFTTRTVYLKDQIRALTDELAKR